ncbi:MAG TPA: FtsK/SpoIIIE domain-containing protein [Lactobacillaceae bacterium]|jgi:fructose-specific component phosphotransferase system IIB-like protein
MSINQPRYQRGVTPPTPLRQLRKVGLTLGGLLIALNVVGVIVARITVQLAGKPFYEAIEQGVKTSILGVMVISIGLISALLTLLVVVIWYLVTDTKAEYKAVRNFRAKIADGNLPNVLGLVNGGKVPKVKLANVVYDKNRVITMTLNIPINGLFNPDKIDVSTLNSGLLKEFVIIKQTVTKNQKTLQLLLQNVTYSRRIIATQPADLQPIDKYTLRLMDGVSWHLSHPSAIISGNSGSGKSYMVGSLIYQAWQAGHEIYIVDPKQDALSVMGSYMQGSAITADETIALLTEVVAKMEARQAYIAQEMGAHQDPFNVNAIMLDMTPIMVFIDEVSALMASVATDKKKRDQLQSLLTTLTVKGRSAMVHMVFITQQANAQNISTEIREQASLKVLLGDSIPAARQFLMPGQELPKTDFGRGTGLGYYVLDGQTDLNAELLETATLEFEPFKEIVRGSRRRLPNGGATGTCDSDSESV